MKCERCGEEVLDPRPDCFYCGARVDRSPPRAPVATSSRFDLAEQRPEYAAARACVAELPRFKIGPALFGIVFGAVVFGFGTVIGSKLDFPAFLVGWWVLGLLFIGAHVPPLLIPIWTVVSPTRRRLAVVVEERQQAEHIVKHEGTSREKHTKKQHYFVTLETRDGKQRKWSCSAKLADKVEVGSLGVAITRGPSLLKFVHLPVPLA